MLQIPSGCLWIMLKRHEQLSIYYQMRSEWISVIFFSAIDLTRNSPKYHLYSLLPIILFSIFPTLIVIKFRLFSATNMTNSILLYIPFFHTWLDQIDSPNLYKAGLATNRGVLPLLHFFFFHNGRVLDEELIVGFDSSGSTSWVQRLLWQREDGSVRNKGVCEVQPQCYRSSSPFMGWWP